MSMVFDNDKKFKSGMVVEWCHNNGVTVMDFPPYSPDLNPIENVGFFEVQQHSMQSTGCG